MDRHSCNNLDILIDDGSEGFALHARRIGGWGEIRPCGRPCALPLPPLSYSSTSYWYRVGKRRTDGGRERARTSPQWLDLSVSLSQRGRLARCVTGVLARTRPYRAIERAGIASNVCIQFVLSPPLLSPFRTRRLHDMFCWLE